MSAWERCSIAAAGLAVAVLAILGGPEPAQAQPGRGDLVITVSESVDPAPSGSEVAYGIAIKNTGRIRARNVVVTVPVPAGTAFVKCTTTPTKPWGPCTLTGGTVVTTFLNIAAHGTSKVNVTLRMPSRPAQSVVSLFVDANGDQVNDATLTIDTTVLGTASTGTYLPSGRRVTLSCGMVLDAAAFIGDTTLRLDGSLGCATSSFALRIAASNKTLDLNSFKIVGPSSGPAAKGSVGVAVAAGKTNVTIRGGTTNGTGGIESFDWCVADEGNNDFLLIETLRCFRGRSAGIDLVSSNVTMQGSLVDKAVGTSSTTFAPPGGVGIRVTGDNVRILNTKVRRSQRIGIWATGVDIDGDGNAITIDGTTTTSKVESNIGMGILTDGHRLRVKDTLVTGDGTAGVSTDGVVVGATATGTVLDGVEVKEFAGNGFVVVGAGTLVTRSRVENVAADGFVVTGAGSTISNNEARTERHGYVVGGPDISVATNLAEGVGGDGFVVDGERASLTNNSAKSGLGHGFVLNGAQATLNTNTAELNEGDGFLVTGTGGAYLGNRAKTNGAVGVRVPGSLNAFSTNLSELSAGFEWILGANNINDGGNKKNGSTFSFGAAGGEFE